MPALVAQLDTDDTRVVATALVAIGRAVDPDMAMAVEDQLLEHLASADGRVGVSAALALGLTGSPSAAEALLELAVCSDRAHKLVGGGHVPDAQRLMAGLALALGDHPQLIDGIRAAADDFADDRNDLSAVLVASLGSMPSARTPDVHAWLLHKLRDKRLDPAIRSVVPTALARHGDRSVVPDMLAVLERSDTHRFVAEAIALALGELVQPDDVEAARALMTLATRGDDATTREFAWLSLARVAARPGSTRVAPEFVADVASLLRRQLEKPRRGSERPFIALAAGLFGRQLQVHRDTMREALLASFDDLHDPQQRGVLALALGLLGDDRASPTLRAALAETHDVHLGGHLAVSLGMLGDTEARDPLRELSARSGIEPWLRSEAALALRLLGDDEASTDLAASMRDTSNQTDRDSLAQALGMLHDLDAVDTLVDLLREPRLDVSSRVAACDALGVLAEKTVLPWRAQLEIGANPLASVVDLVGDRSP